MQNGQQDNPLTEETKPYSQRKYHTDKCIQKYSYMLIRPLRFIYKETLLEPKRKFRDKYVHKVFHIPFPLSLYTPRTVNYVLLYLHGNTSSRCEGFFQLNFLPQDVGLACFDFNACGNRTEKQYITLGKDEVEEVDAAVRFLKGRGLKVAVWGRSMGAVSALLSQSCQVVIADSAFSSLYDTTKELSASQVCKPFRCLFQCLFPCFFSVVGRDVETKCGMHPRRDLEVKDKLAKSNASRHILFLAAIGDQMVHYSHSRILHDSFPGKHKKITLFQGTHNSLRPKEVLDQIFTFAEKALNKLQQAEKQLKIDDPIKVANITTCDLMQQCDTLEMESKIDMKLVFEESMDQNNKFEAAMNQVKVRSFKTD